MEQGDEAAANKRGAILEKKNAIVHSSITSAEDPQKIIRQALLLIALFFGVLGLWATFSKISGAVVAVGKVKIDTERKTVQHLEGGIVEQIFVREGEEVVVGQTLISLESIQIDSSVDMLSKQLVASLASIERYNAEKNLSEFLDFSSELCKMADFANSNDVLSSEVKIFHARREAINGQISLLKSQIRQINSQIIGFDEQIKAEDVIVGTLVEELKAKKQLYSQRYLEKSQILELERLLASHQGNRGRLKQSRAEANQKNDELLLRIDDSTNRFVEDATSQLGRLNNEVLQLKEKIRPLNDMKKRLDVLAPVAGQVVGLKVHSQGGVIRPGEALMDIVPRDTPLIVETQVPVNKIADISIGQEANIQLDAFDIRLTPLIQGKVVLISADRTEEVTPAGKIPYFICYIEADRGSLEKSHAYLSPGMPATVYIATKERTILYYILEPLVKNWHKAMRE